MKPTEEISSVLGNINYYVQRIEILTKKQLEIDLWNEKLKRKIEKDNQVGTVRFNCLGLIGENCEHLEKHCKDIGNCLKIITEQEKR